MIVLPETPYLKSLEEKLKSKPITAPPLPPQALRFPTPAGAPDKPPEEHQEP